MEIPENKVPSGTIIEITNNLIMITFPISLLGAIKFTITDSETESHLINHYDDGVRFISNSINKLALKNLAETIADRIRSSGLSPNTYARVMRHNLIYIWEDENIEPRWEDAAVYYNHNPVELGKLRYVFFDQDHI